MKICFVLSVSISYFYLSCALGDLIRKENKESDKPVEYEISDDAKLFENVKVDLGNDKHFIQIHGRIGQYTTEDTNHGSNDDVKITQDVRKYKG